MSTKTKIEWADRTWSPWHGCTKVSEGCANCYAEGWARRFKKDCWGPGRARILNADWEAPRRWDRAAAKAGWSVKVFPSLCDWRDEAVGWDVRDRFEKLVEATPNLDWLLLTKRVPRFSNHPCPSNVWFGASCENQARLDERLPYLLRVNTPVRWLSLEPLLGLITIPPEWLAGVQWVVVGGESGPGSRPCCVEWIWDIVLQCRRAGVAVFVKQLGSHCVMSGLNGLEWPDDTTLGKAVELDGAFLTMRVRLKHPKGGNPDEWPEDLRVREWPIVKG